jgi:hypothetical protein
LIYPFTTVKDIMPWTSDKNIITAATKKMVVSLSSIYKAFFKR